MPKIEVERKGLDVDYHLEKIIAEMLKNKTRQFVDERYYAVNLQNGEPFKEVITARVEIHLRASDTLLEKAGAEE